MSVVWEKDDDVSNCRACEVKFSLIKRKHHCRSCGRVFCGDCSRLEACLDASPEKKRVCDVCFLRFNDMSCEPPVWRIVTNQTPSILSITGFRLSLIQGGSVKRSIHVFSVVRIRASGSRLTFTLENESDNFVLVCLEPLEIIEAYKEAMQLDFIDLYRGWCDYFFTPPDATLLQEILDREASDNRVLDLTTLPGAQAQHLALDLRPLAR